MDRIRHSQQSAKSKLFCVLLPFLLTLLFTLPVTAEESSKTEREKELEKRLELMNAKLERLESRMDEIDSRLDDFTELEISGFFDVSFSNYKNKPNIFKLGLFELDLEHSYENGFQVAAALVFDDEEGTYIGVGFIDYAFIGGPVPPRGRLFIERGVHIQVGRFDVPLGNDWNYVSPVKRYTVTPPLTTTRIMEGVYNDVGLRLLINFVAANFTLYTTQGIEQKYSFGGISYGSRLGITPFNNPFTVSSDFTPTFELGFSYLYDLDTDGKKSEDVSVIDYESKIGGLILRSEVYKREKVAGVIFEGFHLTTGWDFEAVNLFPMVFVLRYDQHVEKNNVVASFDQAASGDSDKNSLTRMTSALRFNISNTSFLKFEYQSYLTASDNFREDTLFSENLYYAQLVIKF